MYFNFICFRLEKHNVIMLPFEDGKKQHTAKYYLILFFIKISTLLFNGILIILKIYIFFIKGLKCVLRYKYEIKSIMKIMYI